jgi:ABC-type xylose transport system permease subunit
MSHTPENSTLLTVIVALFTNWMLVFKFDWVVSKKAVRPMLTMTTLCFLLGLTYRLAGWKGIPNPNALFTPLATFCLLIVSRTVFIRKIGRYPIDTALNWTPGLAWDRAFSMIVFMGGIFFLMAFLLT